MGRNETSNGKKGGLLKGKPHYDENGKSLGGVKAIVTDTNTPVELEGGEVIINKHASKKYWKELSKINQSAGNGVPIKNPNGSDDEDPEEYKEGGRIINFNPNHLPNKRILTYAKNIKSKYPKVWDLGGNIFGNEAFKNLQRVSERGYWLESEKWMYIKWRSFVARHTHDFRIKGVIAMLKWVDKVGKGWDYMKNLIEAEIEKKYPSKMEQGGQVVTYRNKFNKKYGFGLNDSHSLSEVAKISKIKLSSLQDIYNKGIGAYKTNPESVRPNVKSKEQWAMARVYSAVMGGKASKVDATELSEGKMGNGGLIAPKLVEDDYALTKDNSFEFTSDLAEALNLRKVSYNIVNNVIVRIKDHNPIWTNFRQDLDDNPNVEKVVNVSVLSNYADNYHESQVARSLEEMEDEYPNVKFENIPIEKKTYLNEAIKLVTRDIDQNAYDNLIEQTKMKEGGNIKVKNIIKSDYSNNDDVSEENAEMVRNQNKQILHHTAELKKALDSGVQVPAWVVAKINRATNDMSDATHYLDGTLRYAYGGDIKKGQVYDWNKYGVENVISVNEVKDDMVFYRLNGVPKVRGMKEFVKFLEEHNLKAGFKLKNGGELSMGIKEEKEHINTAQDLYERKITPSESAERIAKEHLKEDTNYYSKLKSNGFMYGGALVESKDKVDMDMKSDIFVNSIIFKSELDYVLGGFNVESLNRIVVKNNLSAISLPKLETIFSDRMELAIEDFKDEIRTNLLKNNEIIDSMEIESDLADELNNLFETYLGFSHYSTNTKDILESIKRDTTYMTWMGRVEKGLKEFTSMLKYSGSDVNYQEQSKISVKEAEELTTNSTFEQMLEKLFYINQENTI